MKYKKTTLEQDSSGSVPLPAPSSPCKVVPVPVPVPVSQSQPPLTAIPNRIPTAYFKFLVYLPSFGRWIGGPNPRRTRSKVTTFYKPHYSAGHSFMFRRVSLSFSSRGKIRLCLSSLHWLSHTPSFVFLTQVHSDQQNNERGLGLPVATQHCGSLTCSPLAVLISVARRRVDTTRATSALSARASFVYNCFCCLIIVYKLWSVIFFVFYSIFHQFICVWSEWIKVRTASSPYTGE